MFSGDCSAHNTVMMKNATVTKRKNASSVMYSNRDKSPFSSLHSDDNDNVVGSSNFSGFVRASDYSMRKRYRRRSSSLSRLSVGEMAFADKILHYRDRIMLWIDSTVPKFVKYLIFVLVAWIMWYFLLWRASALKNTRRTIIPETASALLERQRDQDMQLLRNGSSAKGAGGKKTKETDKDAAAIALMAFKTRHVKGRHYPKVGLFRSHAKDFGGLDMSSDDEDDDEIAEYQDVLTHDSGTQPMPRMIHDDPWLQENDQYRDPHDLLDDEFEPEYVPNEDDYLRFYKEHEGDEKEGHDEDENNNLNNDHNDIKYHPMTDGKITCRRMAWQGLRLTNCNTFHEQNLLDLQMKYLGQGDFRAAASVSISYGNTREQLAYKHILYHSHLEGHEDEDFDYQDLEFMRLDTLVAERMTASPRIFAVFGLCGISSYSELALHGTIEEEIYGETMRDDEDYDYEKHGNNLCSVQKAEYCLQMAQAVADLHGHKDGVIIHEDLKADQFLWNEAKTAIKLNDFSRSVIVMWDDSTQDYCAYDENEQREWRTPEEFKWSHHITEKVDIHNLASVFYIVLLGQAKVDAMDDENDYLLEGGKVIFEQEAREKFSGAEAKLAEIIDWCQADNQEDRPSIFQVVKGLEEALELARQEEHNKLAKNR